jgi:hypothetical protein
VPERSRGLGAPISQRPRVGNRRLLRRAGSVASGTDYDAARELDEIGALWVSDDGRDWNRVELASEVGADVGVVPFEIVTSADLTLAAWPPDPRLGDEPLQIFARSR